MTSDDQLRRAFDTLTDRLRDEMSRQLESAFDEVTVVVREQADEARALRANLEEQEARYREERDRLERAAVQPPAVEPPAVEPPAHSHSADLERLVDSIRALDRSRSLGETLDTLVGCAARETARAAVVLVGGGRIRGWRSIGFETLDDDPRSLDGELADAGVVAEALATGGHATGGAPRFAALPAGTDGLALPIAVGGHVVAVLYADQASNPESAIPHHALELIARHAARCLESGTAFKAARALLAPEGTPAGQPRPYVDGSDDDASARRYARLLVSEIKLYHEPEVAAGRRAGDLAVRLGGEIARARTLYEQRVPPHIRQQTDYFRDELVRTLANGDATLLELRT